MSNTHTTQSLSCPDPLAADESLPWVDAPLLRRMLHDLRAPIRHVRFFEASIRESLPTAMDDHKEQDSIMESLDVLARAGKLMDQSLDHLRELIEATSGDLDSSIIPLQVAIDSAWETVSEQYNVTAQLTCDGDTSLTVLRDPWSSIFRHLFENMFLNRSETVPLEAHIQINPHLSDEVGESKHPWLEQLVVADNGIGIPEKDWHRALLPMQRIRVSQPPRPGLGLTIASQLANRCGYQMEWTNPDRQFKSSQTGTKILMRMKSE